MEERDKKVIAFLAGMLLKLAHETQSLDFNETMQLDNIASEYGFDELSEREFRY